MIDVTKNGCCGCEVCVDACPFNAISMAADGLGFRNATVDMTDVTIADYVIRCVRLK